MLNRRPLRLEYLEDRSLLSLVPTAVDLLPGSDTGILDNDDLTNLDNGAAETALDFAVSGTIAGATVTLYADGVAIGSDVAADTTTTITTDGARDLADGLHSITARQTEPGDTESPDSPALAITVDTGAPLPTDAQIAKLLAADGSEYDDFGHSVSISGSTAIVGAYGDGSGSAYIFEDTVSGWTRVAKLTASDGVAADHFGWSVSISGTTAIVGATWDDAHGVCSGSAYIFEDTGSGWTQVAKVTAPDGGEHHYFGISVAVSGNVAIVGARRDDDNGSGSGSAYVFEDTGSGWTQVAKWTAADGEADDLFGCSVSISGTRAIVGALGDDDKGSTSGSAYIFEDTGSGWVQVGKLTAADGAAGAGFGDSVSISGTRAIVGARGDDDKGSDSGSAYIFEDTGSGWVQVAKLTAADGAASDYFGDSVSISGDVAVVGAYFDDDKGSDSGSAYVFEDTGSGWTQIAKRTAADGEAGDIFGRSVSISGTTAIIGASWDDDNGTYSGSAYVFLGCGETLLNDTGASATDRLTSDTTPKLTFAFTEPVHGQDGDVTVLDPNGDPIVPDSIAGWGTDTLVVAFNTPLNVDGEYAVTLIGTGTITDAAGNRLNNGIDQGVNFVLDSVAPATPAAPDLQSLSDAGISDSDNLTNDNTPTFDAIGAPYFRVYCDGVQVSGDYESGSGTTIPQSDGTHQYTVTAVDAAGNESPSSVAVSVTIDTVAPLRPGGQIAKLLATDGAEYAYFGGSVAVSGTRAIVGAPWDNEEGSAYIFEDATWGGTYVAKLKASDFMAFDEFGCSVSIDGSTAIVGACGDADNGSESGSVYIFEDTGSGLTQDAKLTAADGAMYDYFGYSVSISGTTAIVGAPYDDDKGSYSGSAYILEDTGSGWAQVAKLTAADGAASDYFGISVSISGNVAVVGAYYDDDKGSNSGSVYIFEDTGSGWVQVGKLTAADGEVGDSFGSSVSISGNVAIVGACYDDDKGSNSGSAYVFEETGSGWTQVAKRTAADGEAGDMFGCSVCISGTMAVVGALFDDDKGSDSGSAYVLEETGSGWTQVAKWTAADGEADDFFGCSVSISGNVAIVGACDDDDNGTSSGSAHIFLFSGETVLANDTGASACDRVTSDTTPELTFTFTEPVYGQDGDVTVLDPNGDPVVPDSITGWGTDTLVVAFNMPLNVDGEYTVTLIGTGTITDAAGNWLNNGIDQSVDFTLDTAAPAAPAAVDLQSLSDTGVSDSDNLTNDNTPTFDAIGAPYFRVYRDGVQVSNDYESGSYTDAALLDGIYTYTVTAVDTAGNESAPSAPVSITIDTIEPSVESVLVKGTAWTDGFLDDLDAAGFGHPDAARLGYRVPAGAGQLNALPWGNIDTVTVVFGEDVLVAREDLALCGLNVAEYAVAVFSYDAGAHAATWTLARRIDVDTVALTLAGAVQDSAGNAVGGGEFEFAMNVLPGDATGGGVVNDVDAAIMAAHWAASGVTRFGDFNGDGLVDTRDASILGAHWGQRIEPLLPGDANRDGIVDGRDAAILGGHWLLSGMTWAQGDFNDDRRVDDQDAAILAAHWGATAEQTAGEGAPVTSVPTEPALPLWDRPIGPREAAPAGAARRPVKPLPARELAARDAVFAETYGSDSNGETDLLRRRLAWSYELAQQRGQKRSTGPCGADARRLDALLAAGMM